MVCSQLSLVAIADSVFPPGQSEWSFRALCISPAWLNSSILDKIPKGSMKSFDSQSIPVSCCQLGLLFFRPSRRCLGCKAKARLRCPTQLVRSRHATYVQH